MKNGIKISIILGIAASFVPAHPMKELTDDTQVPTQKYHAKSLHVESDWSGAGYWYSLVALAGSGNIILEGLKEKSYQGDRRIANIMKSLGVMSHFQNEGVLLTKTKPVSYFEYNFSDCPDLVQTVAVICAANEIKAVFRGIESLRIKETDRISALQNELSKIGAQLTEQGNGTWHLIPATNLSKDSTIEIKTYEDHRMAMAFAPLVTRTNLIIENPDVVIKSYPNFWNDLHKAGIN